MTKIVNIGNQDKMKAGLEEMKRGLSTWLEYNQLIAKIRRSAYDAYIKEGFTSEQALELCKSIML